MRLNYGKRRMKDNGPTSYAKCTSRTTSYSYSHDMQGPVKISKARCSGTEVLHVKDTCECARWPTTLRSRYSHSRRIRTGRHVQLGKVSHTFQTPCIDGVTATANYLVLGAADSIGNRSDRHALWMLCVSLLFAHSRSTEGLTPRSVTYVKCSHALPIKVPRAFT